MNISYVRTDKGVFVNNNLKLEKRDNVDNIDKILYQENYIEALVSRRDNLGMEMDYEKKIDDSKYAIIGGVALAILSIVLTNNLHPESILATAENLLKPFLIGGSITFSMVGIVKKIKMNNYLKSLEKQRDFLLNEINKEVVVLEELKKNSKEVSTISKEITDVKIVRFGRTFDLKMLANFLYGGEEKKYMKLYRKNKISKIRVSDEVKPYIEELAKKDVKVLSKVKK